MEAILVSEPLYDVVVDQEYGLRVTLYQRVPARRAGDILSAYRTFLGALQIEVGWFVQTGFLYTQVDQFGDRYNYYIHLEQTS